MNILDNRDNVLKVVQSVKKMTLKRVKKKSSDFIKGNDASMYKMQLVVSLFKIPSIPPNGKVNFRTVMSKIPHSYIDEHSDVLFICKTKKPNKTARIDNDYSVNAFKDLLFNYDASDLVSEVIALTQLKTDYIDFEARQKLARQFDVVLCDRSLQHHLPSFLGKAFYRTKKRPLPVDTRNNLKIAIEDALSKTPLYLDMLGSCSTCQVGYVRQKDDHLIDNILAVVESWRERIPGGWENINSIQIKSEISKSIPLYIANKHPQNVSMPTIPTQSRDEIIEVSSHDFLPDSVKLGIKKSGDIVLLPDDEEAQAYVKNRLESKDTDTPPNIDIQQKIDTWSDMNNALNIAIKKGRWHRNPFEKRYINLQRMNDVAGIIPDQMVSDAPVELEWDQLDIAAKSNQCRWLSQKLKRQHSVLQNKTKLVDGFVKTGSTMKNKYLSKALMKKLFDHKTKRRLAIYPDVVGWEMNRDLNKSLAQVIRKTHWQPPKSK